MWKVLNNREYFYKKGERGGRESGSVLEKVKEMRKQGMKAQETWIDQDERIK